LARSFRLFEKKRGHRRTGSKQLGRLGELGVSALFLLAGCLFFGLVLHHWFLPAWKVNRRFVETGCLVLDKRLAQSQKDGGAVYRPEIQIEYRVEGTTYRIWTYSLPNLTSGDLAEKQEILSGFHVGQEYACWYDPTSPSTAVLVRGFSWSIWLAFVVPVSFILLGGVGLVHALLRAGTSAERRAALAKRAAKIDLFDAGRGKAADYPTVPDSATINDSPGTRLAYRLPLRDSPAWPLVVLGATAAGWNLIVGVFVAVAVSGYVQGQPDWILSISLVPFLAIGIGLLVYFVYRILLANGIGPTLIEISEHPFAPGGRYSLFVSQAGRLRFSAFTVSLVSEEEATYRQGTDTRVERRTVFRQEIFRREGFEIHRGTPLEVACELDVPGRAMHSFRARHNEVRWKLTVEGRLAGWPGYRRDFPVIVRPGNGSTQG